MLLRQIQEQLGEQPRLYLGAEVRIDSAFSGELANLTKAGILSLAGSSYLLVEFERRQLSVDPISTIEEVVTAGLIPVVAHPEFVPGLRDDLDLAHGLVEAGALMQITSMSLTGKFGDRTRDCVEALLDADLVHFVASDAHGIESRRPDLHRARRVLVRTRGEEIARRLTYTNPLAVIENRRIPTAKPGTPAGVALH